MNFSFKLLHALSRRGVKHFKYTHINYQTQQTCNNNNNFNYNQTSNLIITKTKIARKNNKSNRRKAAFYRINKFDYKARENLAKGQSPSKETSIKEDKKVELSPENA